MFPSIVPSSNVNVPTFSPEDGKFPRREDVCERWHGDGVAKLRERLGTCDSAFMLFGHFERRDESAHGMRGLKIGQATNRPFGDTDVLMAGEIDEQLEDLFVIEALGEPKSGSAHFRVDVRQAERELGFQIARHDVDDL